MVGDISEMTLMNVKFSPFKMLLKIEAAIPLIVALGADVGRDSSAGFIATLALVLVLTIIECSTSGWSAVLLTSGATTFICGGELFVLLRSQQLHGPIAVYGPAATLGVIGGVCVLLGFGCHFAASKTKPPNK